MVIEAKAKGIKNIIVSRENMQEAALVKDINIFGFNTLREVTNFLEEFLHIIIETSENSATLATVEYANQIWKKVYAVPHSIYSKEGQGTNNLIYRNKVDMFLPKLKSLKQNDTEKINVQLNEIQRKILLSSQPTSINR